MISIQAYRWHSVTLSCLWSPVHEDLAVHFSVYLQEVNHKSTVQFLQLLPLSLSFSFSLYLSPSLPPFYPHPGASAFEEIQFEILSCIFHELNLFFIPGAVLLLERCFIDIAWERLWSYWSVSTYSQTVRESSLFLNPFGPFYLRSPLKFNTINKSLHFYSVRQESGVGRVLFCSLTSTCSPCDTNHWPSIKELRGCMGF